MSNPEEVGAMFRAMLNQIPDTMPSSQAVFERFLALSPVREDDVKQRLDQLHGIVTEWVSVLAVNTIALENRIERLEGRPGIPEDSLDAIMSEFRGVGG